MRKESVRILGAKDSVGLSPCNCRGHEEGRDGFQNEEVSDGI